MPFSSEFSLVVPPLGRPRIARRQSTRVRLAVPPGSDWSTEDRCNGKRTGHARGERPRLPTDSHNRVHAQSQLDSHGVAEECAPFPSLWTLASPRACPRVNANFGAALRPSRRAATAEVIGSASSPVRRDAQQNAHDQGRLRPARSGLALEKSSGVSGDLAGAMMV